MNAGAEAIKIILERLGPLDPPLKIEHRSTALILTPTASETFEISVYDQGDEAMIAAERWHTHYDDPMDAAFCVLWLLTPFYRLVHELKGGVLVGAWIERYEVDGWEGFEPVYFLNPEHPDSWLPTGGETLSRRYFVQNLIPPPAPYEQLCPGVVLDDRGWPPGVQLGITTIEVNELMAPTLNLPD